MASYDTFAEAYETSLRSVLKGTPAPATADPLSVGSSFGAQPRPTRELIGHRFVVARPDAPLVSSEPRTPNVVFSVGLLLWTLAGSDELPWISYYNPRGKDFSDDGRTLAGAFGRRLNLRAAGSDQLDALVERINADPATRRATAVVLSPEDVHTQTKDFPCLIAIQYFVRDGALHALTYMRSQSALMVLPYDAFLFMMLQAWIAAKAGMPVGSYTHFSGSFHIYEDEIELAEKVLAAGITPVSVPPLTDPDCLPEVLAFESAVREAATRHDIDFIRRAVQAFEATPCFFGAVRALLLVEAAIRCDLRDEARRISEMLPADFSSLLKSVPERRITLQVG